MKKLPLAVLDENQIKHFVDAVDKIELVALLRNYAH